MKFYFLLIGIFCIFLASCQEEPMEKFGESPKPEVSTDGVWQFEQEALRKGIENGDMELPTPLPADSILPVFTLDATPSPGTRAFSQQDTRNWMSRIDGNRGLTELSIPGTHNSAADCSGKLNCQNRSITQQLEWGVRVFDLRCRHVNDAFFIHHDRFYQNKTFGSVMNEINNFLNKYPSETVIMFVKEEYNAAETTRSFDDTFKWYMNDYRWINKIWKDEGQGLPKSLNAARGKIIPICRFSSRDYMSISWSDNTTFETMVGGIKVHVQDRYFVSTAYWMDWKWKEIYSVIKEAATSGIKDILYVNYLNGSSSGLLPWDCAHGCNGFWGMNYQFYRYCDGQNRRQRMGVIMQDFCQDDYHTNNIIQSNNYPRIEDKPTIWGVESQETVGEDGRAENAIDGNPNTWWHSQYTGNYNWNGWVSIGIRYPTMRNFTGIAITQRPGLTTGRPGAFKVEIKKYDGSWMMLYGKHPEGGDACMWTPVSQFKDGEQLFYFYNTWPGTDYRVTFLNPLYNTRYTYVSEIRFF